MHLQKYLPVGLNLNFFCKNAGRTTYSQTKKSNIVLIFQRLLRQMYLLMKSWRFLWAQTTGLMQKTAWWRVIRELHKKNLCKAQSKHMLLKRIKRFFTISLLLYFQTRTMLSRWRCYRTVFWELENILISCSQESLKLKAFCNFFMKTLERERSTRGGSRIKKREQLSASPLSKCMRAETGKCRLSKKLREDHNDGRSWLRFQSSAHYSIFAICLTHLNIAPEAITTHWSATFPIRFFYEDPDTSSIVTGGSQQNWVRLHLMVASLLKIGICIPRRVLRLAIQLPFFQKDLKPFDSTPKERWNHHIQDCESD